VGSLLLEDSVEAGLKIRVYARRTRVLAIALAVTLGLASFTLLDSVQQNIALWRSFVGAVVVLLAWNAALAVSAVRRGRTLALEVVVRKQHYVQACAQGAVLLYWGWYWREVFDWAYLIGAQLLFAYAFDMLLQWSRRDDYAFGFGPFPVIFSINLFLWFRPDWFYMQLLLVAVGFSAKELIRWRKDGRPAHIFNPSSFPLAVFAIALLVTGRSDITWGREIASTQFYPPHMYLFLFLIGLPGQFVFGVTTMTMAAVVTAYVFGLLYYAATGIYFFHDSYIPIAVFLGMQLLFTDPSTSPRTELGRLMFGALYGLSTVALYGALGHMGLPTFYDKLLQVPVLNLSIKLIDRAVRSLPRPASRQRNLAYISVWAVVFVAMSAVQGVGDDHPGQWLPFWQRACAEGQAYACSYAERIVTDDCDRGSTWACSELQRPPGMAMARPALEDYPIVLRGSKGPIRDVSPAGLAALACREGWPGSCPPR
jgi:hypothetical protein